MQGFILTPTEAGTQDEKKLKIEEEVNQKMEELVALSCGFWK